MRMLLIAMLLIVFAANGFAQNKYEREVRVRERDVPPNALNFVHSMNFPGNIRWYKEIGENRISFEAKTRYNREKYSIEFSSDGTFEDMEIEISPEDLPPSTYSKIEEYLLSGYGWYDIEKVQVQYSGDPEMIKTNFRNRKNFQGVDIHFEMVISTRVEGSFRLFEYLFTEAGDYVRSAMIIEKSINNIIY